MKLIPAVFFQKRVNGYEPDTKLPERLELFESELREIVGGLPTSGGGGTYTTFSWSKGWADVLQEDDTHI